MLVAVLFGRRRCLLVKDWLTFFLLYGAICAVPAVILKVRGRGWRPRFLALTLLLGWTGGGWLIMAWIAVAERNAFVPPAVAGRRRTVRNPTGEAGSPARRFAALRQRFFR